MKFFVFSHQRPDAPIKMQKALQGIQPIWLLGKDNDIKRYKENGMGEFIEGLSLLEARNYALEEAFKDGSVCVQINDDLRNDEIKVFTNVDFAKAKKDTMLGINHEVLRMKQSSTIKEVADIILHELQKTPYKLGGCSPTTNPMNLRNSICERAFIIADLTVCLPTELRYDTFLSLKEDYDFSLQHIKRYGGVVRLNYVFCDWEHKTKGGVHSIRNVERERKNITYLKQKWGEDVIKDSSTREGEIRVNFKKTLKDVDLVTGGCGFVGRHLVKDLLKRGRYVYIIDDLSIGHHPTEWLTNEEMQHIVFIEEDCIKWFMKNENGKNIPAFKDVYHLASIVGGRELIDGDPILVGKDLSIDAMFFYWITRNKKKLQRVLYASSSAAYPITLQTSNKKIGLVEDMLTFGASLGQPDMTYGWSKMSGEYLATLAHKHYGIHIACVRPFSGYGEDQDLTYPFPSISRRIARRENPIEVWGTGEQARDFIHIDDCIQAFYVALEHIQDGGAVNIGSGHLTSFNTLIQKMALIAGYTHFNIRQLTDKPVGVHNRFCDPSKLLGYGWRQTISLEEGIKRCILYQKNSNINEALPLQDS